MVVYATNEVILALAILNFLGSIHVEYRRGFKERRTGRTPPPKISKDYRVFGDIYTCTCISVNSLYIIIIKLPLNSDFISIIRTDSAMISRGG